MFSKFIAWKFKCFVYKNKQSSYIVPNYLKLAKKKNASNRIKKKQYDIKKICPFLNISIFHSISNIC